MKCPWEVNIILFAHDTAMLAEWVWENMRRQMNIIMYLEEVEKLKYVGTTVLVGSEIKVEMLSLAKWRVVWVSYRKLEVCPFLPKLGCLKLACNFYSWKVNVKESRRLGVFNVKCWWIAEGVIVMDRIRSKNIKNSLEK